VPLVALLQLEPDPGLAVLLWLKAPLLKPRTALGMERIDEGAVAAPAHPWQSGSWEGEFRSAGASLGGAA